MIKIPEEKYNGLYNTHFKNIESYLKDAIQFYINCCKIIGKDIKSSDYKTNVRFYYGCKTLKSLLSVISTENYKDIKSIKNTFNSNKIKIEFQMNYKKIKGFLEQMIKPSSNIYIEKIIISEPSDLVIIYKRIFNCCKNMKENNRRIARKNGVEDSILRRILNRIFNYERFLNTGFYNKWNAYKLCEKLDVNVCPYCNRIYTFTVIKTNKNSRQMNRTKSNVNLEKNIIRPELDHYFSQSRYPMFALSFFNLIPCCKICNSSIKGDKELNLKKNLHPYIDGISDNYRFDYKPLDIKAFNGSKEDIEVIITKDIMDFKSDNNLKFFKIDTIYRKHNDVVTNLISRRKIYTEELLNEIENILNSNGKIASKDELFKSTFNPPEANEILNISLGKLNKDIIDKLRSIK